MVCAVFHRSKAANSLAKMDDDAVAKHTTSLLMKYHDFATNLSTLNPLNLSTTQLHALRIMNSLLNQPSHVPVTGANSSQLHLFSPTPYLHADSTASPVTRLTWYEQQVQQHGAQVQQFYQLRHQQQQAQWDQPQVQYFIVSFHVFF